MRRAAIVAPVRTPIGTFGGAIKALSAADLATTVLRAVIERAAVDAAQNDDVVFAQSHANSEAPCIRRWGALNAGLPVEVPGLQIDRRWPRTSHGNSALAEPRQMSMPFAASNWPLPHVSAAHSPTKSCR
jgi:hypothetical protein